MNEKNKTLLIVIAVMLMAIGLIVMSLTATELES